MKEAGILDLLLGGLAKLDIPVLGEVLKVLLEGKGQRWLRSKLVDDLLAILLGKGTHGLREVLRAPLFKVDHVHTCIERPLDISIVRSMVGEDTERGSRNGNGRNDIIGIDERLRNWGKEDKERILIRHRTLDGCKGHNAQ